jgi:hypothetical protein
MDLLAIDTGRLLLNYSTPLPDISLSKVKSTMFWKFQRGCKLGAAT